MKKLLSVLLTVVLLIGAMPTMAFAAENEYSKADYQAVFDKLNSRYGTGTRFATPEELQKIGLKPEKINISPAEYEKEMIKAIEAEATVTREAVIASQKLRRVQADESGSGICVPGKSVTPLAAYYHTKRITGANAHLEATVNNTGGFWSFGQIGNVWTSADQSIPYPWFAAQSYNYTLLDTRRTCAISFSGYTIDRYGSIVSSNASRYVEFWAGTNMGTP